MSAAPRQPAPGDPNHGPNRGGDALRKPGAAASGLLMRAQAWMLAHRVATVIAASCLSIVTVTALVLWLSTVHPPTPSRRPPTPFDALAAYDRGEYALASKLAEKFHADEDVAPKDRFISPYILGMLTIDQAKKLPERRRVRQAALAARLLEESFESGWPDPRVAEGLRQWGRGLLLSHQPIQARDVLRNALRQPDQRRAEVEQMLVDAYSDDPRPDLNEALAHSTALLALDELTPADRQRALIDRANLLAALGRWDEADAALAQIPADSPFAIDATIERAKKLLDQARRVVVERPANLPPAGENSGQPAVLARRALDLIEKLPSSARISRSDLARIEFLTARARAILGESDAALSLYGQLVARSLDMPEGWASLFEEAELLRVQQRDDDAMSDYLRALAPLRRPEPFRNRWFSHDELRQRLLAAYESFVGRKQFSAALKLVDAGAPLLSTERSTLLITTTQVTWARWLNEQAERAVPSAADALFDQAREHFRAAGRGYQKLARQRFVTRQYPEDVWEAAQNYLAGQDYVAAGKMLDHYLRLGARDHRRQALIHMAEALAAQDQVDEALELLDESLEQAGDEPSTYQARLLAATLRWQIGGIDQAVELLNENLSGDLLTPAARPWRDSLWTLCRMLVAEHRWDQAVPRLDEAMARWPQLPQTVEMTYLSADAYRQLGLASRHQAANAETDAIRKQATQRAAEYFQIALPRFRQVQQQLLQHEEEPGLTLAQQRTLRNSYFAIGQVLYELAQFEPAIDVYRDAAVRYQDSTESLEALVRIASCYRGLHRDELAVQTLLQAKAALHQLELAGNLTGAAPYTPAQWIELISALETL